MNKLIPAALVLSTSLIISGCVVETNEYAPAYPSYNVVYTNPGYNWGTNTYWGYRYGDPVYDDYYNRGYGGYWYMP